MADRNFRRAPRWVNTGYWEERSEEERRSDDRREGSNRGDDGLRARTYDRNDQRRYARRSQEQGQRLRSLRGYEQERNVHYPEGSDAPRGGEPWRRHREPDDYRGPREGGSRDYRSREPNADFDFPYDMDDRPGSDRVSNYYGERELRQRYGEDYIEGGYISARGEERYQQTDQNQGRENDYDMDPGFAYEFGTRYDISSQLRPDTDDRNRNDRFLRDRQDRDRDDRYDRNDRGHGRAAARHETWDVPGPYRGMGPQNYRRPDERIMDEIYRLFTRSGAVDARRIEVDVRGGQVNLRGIVERKHEKRLAEDMAASVTGVREVNNYILARRK